MWLLYAGMLEFIEAHGVWLWWRGGRGLWVDVTLEGVTVIVRGSGWDWVEGDGRM